MSNKNYYEQLLTDWHNDFEDEIIEAWEMLGKPTSNYEIVQGVKAIAEEVWLENIPQNGFVFDVISNAIREIDWESVVEGVLAEHRTDDEEDETEESEG